MFVYIEISLWTDSQLASATRVDHNCRNESVFSHSERTKCKPNIVLGFNYHLWASHFAGFVDNVGGASEYLKAPRNLAEITHILDCCVQSRKEYLDVVKLISEGVPYFPDLQDGNRMSEATHVVVGITYGARAYCVLTQEVDKTDKEAVKEIEEALFKKATKMKNALKCNQDLAAFQEELFEKEKQEMARLQCQLYADLQVQPVRDCYLFDAYETCHQLFQEVRKTDITSSKAVPITVYLCPLIFFVDATKIKFRAVYDYDDEDDLDYTLGIDSALREYETIIAKVKAVPKTTKTEQSIPLRGFCNAIGRYQNIIKHALQEGVLNARKKQCNVKTLESICKFVSNHPLFDPSVLETWLGYKTAEIELVARMSNLNGITFFANKKQLEEELINCFNVKYALVLWIPSLDQQTNAIIKTMTDYLDTCKMELAEFGTGKEEDDKIPWHVDHKKRNQVLSKVRELVNHVDRNNEPKFRTFVVVGDGLDCHFSIYQDGNLLKEKLDRLPKPPTGIRTLDSSPSEIHLKWDSEDLEYPGCHFVVQYQPKCSTDDVPWTQMHTAILGETQTTIKTEKTLQIAVAAVTYIGYSEFSEMVYAEPKMEDKMESSAEETKQVAAGKRKRLS